MQTALQKWEIITAFLLPLILSFVMQQGWSDALKSLAMFFVSMGVTLMQMYLRGELTNWTDPVSTVLLVVAMTIAFYKGFWKPTGVAGKIESATTIQKP